MNLNEELEKQEESMEDKKEVIKEPTTKEVIPIEDLSEELDTGENTNIESIDEETNEEEPDKLAFIDTAKETVNNIENHKAALEEYDELEDILKEGFITKEIAERSLESVAGLSNRISIEEFTKKPSRVNVSIVNTYIKNARKNTKISLAKECNKLTNESFVSMEATLNTLEEIEEGPMLSVRNDLIKMKALLDESKLIYDKGNDKINFIAIRRKDGEKEITEFVNLFIMPLRMIDFDNIMAFKGDSKDANYNVGRVLNFINYYEPTSTEIYKKIIRAYDLSKEVLVSGEKESVNEKESETNDITTMDLAVLYQRAFSLVGLQEQDENGIFNTLNKLVNSICVKNKEGDYVPTEDELEVVNIFYEIVLLMEYFTHSHEINYSLFSQINYLYK